MISTLWPDDDNVVIDSSQRMCVGKWRFTNTPGHGWTSTKHNTCMIETFTQEWWLIMIQMKWISHWKQTKSLHIYGHLCFVSLSRHDIVVLSTANDQHQFITKYENIVLQEHSYVSQALVFLRKNHKLQVSHGFFLTFLFEHKKWINKICAYRKYKTRHK